MNSPLRTLVMAALAAVVVIGGATSSRAEHTPLQDVRACLPIGNGQHVVGSVGGLMVVDATGAKPIWTAKSGLPGTHVHAVAAALGGGAWIGTEHGLAKLEGDWRTLKTVGPRLRVWSLAEHAGAVWLGTREGTLVRLDTATGKTQTIRYRKTKSGHVRRGGVTAVVVHGGDLYIGTAGDGVFRLQADRLVAVQGKKLGVRWIRAMESHGGRLWVASIAGVVSIGRDGVRDEHNDHVRAFGAEGATLVSGTHGGKLLRWDGKRSRTKGSSAVGPIQALTFGPRSTGVCVASNSGVWVGPNLATLSRVPLAGLPNGDISALALSEDGKRLWVGFFDRGLGVLENGQFRAVPGVDRNVNALAVRPGKGLYVGTGHGLYRVRVEAKGLRVTVMRTADGLPHNSVLSLAPGANGELLVGTPRGLAMVGDDGISTLGRKQGLPSGWVWSVALGPSGRALVGTARGLYRFNAKSKRWQRLSIVSGHLKDDYVTALVVRGQTAWAGTYKGGVVRLKFLADGAIATKHLGGGWVNVAGLRLVGDTLVASTMNGLLSRKVGASGPWKHVANAAPGRDVTATVPDPQKPGTLWVSSRRGLGRAEL